MTHRLQNNLIVLLLLCCIVDSVIAQKPPSSANLEIRLKRPPASEMQGNVRINAVSGFPEAIYNLRHKIQAASPVAMAMQYLESQKQVLGFSSEMIANLKLHKVRESDAGTTIRLRQYVQNIPVYGAEVTITISPDLFVNFFSSSFRHGVRTALDVPQLTAEDASDVVLEYLNITGVVTDLTTELVVFDYLKNEQLYYKVNLNSDAPLGYWEALVSAETGELIMLEDRACYHDHDGPGNSINRHFKPPLSASGMGYVFDPDPLSYSGVAYGGGYVDGGDATTSALDGARASVELKDLTFDGSMYKLTGPYADIQDFESPFNGTFAQATSTFNFDRQSDAFEAVNLYYHIDASMRYVNETLNLGIMPQAYTGGVRIDPHGLSGADNSHYIAGLDRIAFGEGGVDDAEDSDVIHHELGHGLHDWVTGGSLSQVDGLSEGSGDYWAASYNRSLGLWTTSDPAYNWVFNWDGHNPFWGGRIVNYTATYPGGLTGSIHTDGQIWSTAMMKVWDAIGKMKADKAFWNGLGMTNSTSNQNDAANAVLQAAINMGYNHNDLVSMRNIFLNTGYTMPALPPPATNDECASAMTLNQSSSCVTVSGSSQLATNSMAACIGAADDDVWYKFVATGSTATIKVTGNNDYDPVFEVFSDCMNAIAGSCTNATGAGGLETYEASGLTVGNTYFIRVYHFSDQVPSDWTFNICVYGVLAPENDECTSATMVTVNADADCNTKTSGTIAGATASMMDDHLCVGEENDDVWFVFTANSNVHEVSFSNIQGNTSPLHWSIWKGSCAALTLVQCHDGATSAGISTKADSMYFVRVYSSSALPENTTFEICVSSFGPPPPPCDEQVLTLTESYLPNGTYHAIEQLLTNGQMVVPDNGVTLLKSGISIDLNELFEIRVGAVFLADIEPCDLE